MLVVEQIEVNRRSRINCGVVVCLILVTIPFVIVMLYSPENSSIVNHPDYSELRSRRLTVVFSVLVLFVSAVVVLHACNLKYKRATQRKFAQNEAELKSLVVELAAKNEELESIIFASYHDLRTPIVNLNGFAYELSQSYKMLQKLVEGRSEDRSEILKLLQEHIPQELEMIVENSDRISKLQQSLLEISKIGQKIISVGKVDMNELVYAVLEEIPEIAEGKIDVYVKALPNCAGDAVLLKKACKNIIENAVRFVRFNVRGEITIFATTSNNMISYHFEDNGIGIDEKYCDDVFGLFYQIDPSVSAGRIGLGLTIAKRIISRHNGEITVKSSLGSGSTFTVQLPDNTS